MKKITPIMIHPGNLPPNLPASITMDTITPRLIRIPTTLEKTVITTTTLKRTPRMLRGIITMETSIIPPSFQRKNSIPDEIINLIIPEVAIPCEVVEEEKCKSAGETMVTQIQEGPEEVYLPIGVSTTPQEVINTTRANISTPEMIAGITLRSNTILEAIINSRMLTIIAVEVSKTTFNTLKIPIIKTCDMITTMKIATATTTSVKTTVEVVTRGQ